VTAHSNENGSVISMGDRSQQIIIRYRLKTFPIVTFGFTLAQYIQLCHMTAPLCFKVV